MKDIDFVKQHNDANIKIHEAMRELPHQELFRSYGTNFGRNGDKITIDVRFEIPFTIKDTPVECAPWHSHSMSDFKPLDPAKVMEYEMSATGMLNIELSINIKDCKVKYKLINYHVSSVEHGKAPLNYKYSTTINNLDSVEKIINQYIGWRSDSTKADALGRKTPDVEYINNAINSIVDVVTADSKSSAVAMINNLQAYKTLKKLK